MTDAASPPPPLPPESSAVSSSPAPLPPPPSRRILPIVCLGFLTLLVVVLWRAIPGSRATSERADEKRSGEPDSTDDGNAAKNDDTQGADARDPQEPANSTTNSGESGDATTGKPSPATTAEPQPSSEPREKVTPSPGSTPAPPAPPAPEPLPWQATLDLAEPTRFADVAFDIFDVQRRLPSRQDLQRWFEPVAGHGLRMAEQNLAYGRFTMFEGTMRFKAPLTDGLALHLLLDSYIRLAIHCYAGERGVTFVHLQDDSDRWVAYATQRKPGNVTPESWAWTASDDGRVRRSAVRNAGAIQLRHLNGELIITHGNLVLVRAPLAEAPDEVFFSGRVMPLGIELLKTKEFAAADLPPDDGPDAPLAVADLTRTGAELAWSGNPAPAAKAEVVEGAWKLSVEKSDKRGMYVTPLPGEGLFETIIELADVEPGVGLFLSDGVQPPTQTLRFVADARLKGLSVIAQPENDLAQYPWPSPTEAAVPFVTSSPWIRIVSGAAGARWWISVDGQHWAEPPMTTTVPWTACSHLGVSHVANVPHTGLTIRSIRRRPLAAIESLAPAELRAKAQPVLAPDLPMWETQTAATRPADVELATWRRAVALRSLATGKLGALGPLLLEMLLDDALKSDLPLGRQLRLLVDAQLLLDVRNQAPLAIGLANRYHNLGLGAFTKHGAYPVTAVRSAFLSTPFESRHPYPLIEPLAVRSELLARLYNDDWEGTVDFCRQTRFYNQHLRTPLFEWADALARRTTPALDKPSGLPVATSPRGRTPFFGRRGRFPGLGGKTKLPWQHPLAEELSKETYNALAELQGMLDGQAFDDAARTVATLDPAQTPGLAPAGDDNQLLLTLAAAVRRAAKEYPELGVALERHFGQVAPLRVRQAIQLSDPEAVQRVATIFPGTAAAAEAHRWLGDHALALGWFALAQAEYRRGLIGAPDDASRGELSARLRFAAAMTGKEEGAAPSAPVTLADRSLSPTEFESLVTDLRQRSSQQAIEPVTAVAGALAPAPPPGARSTPVRAVLDGPLGENPQEEATPNLNRFQVDWAGRQIATLVIGGRLLVNNRFQLAAYDLASGQRLWQTAVPAGKKSGKSREWGLIPMAPLVVGNRVFARQLFSDGPTLGCWDLATGQPTWLADTVKGLNVVSDPVMLQGRLAAICAIRGDGGDWTLRLVTFDADRGEPLEQVDLVRLQTSWLSRHMCAVRAIEDGLVMSMGGFVLRCDGWARVLWIRRQVVLPTDEEPEWVTQYFDPPLAHGGRLYVAQPGVRAVECIDAETGQLVWRRCLPDVRRVAGIQDGKLLVSIDAGMVALDAKTGDNVWRHDAPEATAEILLGGPGGLAYVSQRKTADAKKTQLGLVWLDPKTGKPTATHPFAALDDEAPRIGPVVTHENRWWVFFGRGQNEPKRELLELTP